LFHLSHHFYKTSPTHHCNLSFSTLLNHCCIAQNERVSYFQQHNNSKFSVSEVTFIYYKLVSNNLIIRFNVQNIKCHHFQVTVASDQFHQIDSSCIDLITSSFSQCVTIKYTLILKIYSFHMLNITIHKFIIRDNS
jgi:hypothetical protein